jgi:subtilisin family serine protease
MRLRPSRLLLIIACVGWTAPLLPGATAKEVWKAAAAGDTASLVAAIDAKAPLDAPNAEGLTPLMLAAKAGSFACCRELLWAKVDTTATDAHGQTALALVPKENPDYLPLSMLLRCSAYLAKHAHPATTMPSRPGLVMIMEDTVNYLHPLLKSAYLVNEKELGGKPGVDDDGDGFVDDVYGWLPVTNKPYTIRPAQFEAYKANREAIAKILAIDKERAEGRLSGSDAEERLAEWTNPLSAIMGPMEELSDKAFLDMMKSAAHGTHVAGIVLAASQGKAQLNTLAVDFSEESRHPFGRGSAATTAKLVDAARSPGELLRNYRDLLAKTGSERAQIGGRYLQATGAGVVNMSFGGSPGYFRGVANNLVQAYSAHRQETESDFSIEEDALTSILDEWSIELFAASQVEFVQLFAENPQVLFVVAAGNENSNNDENVCTPAYFSRFFPNVLTVAACTADGGSCGFTNYGPLSVDLSAPGQDIESTVIPESSLYMSGTSMAAPFVSGTAALLRLRQPALTAADARRLISYTVREEPSHRRYTATSGVIDPDMLFALIGTDAKAKGAACARAARTASRVNDDNFPRSTPDAVKFSKLAVELAPDSADAWLARALALKVAGRSEDALAASDQNLRLAPTSDDALIVRYLILLDLGRQQDALKPLSTTIDQLVAKGEAAQALLARRLLLRAKIEKTLGDDKAAERDVTEAVRLDPELTAPTE